MDVLIFLVPLALGLGGLGLAGFLWSLNSDQYDDLEGAAWRAIMDDDTIPASASQEAQVKGATALTKPSDSSLK